MMRLFAGSAHDASPLDFRILLISTNFWMELTSPQLLLQFAKLLTFFHVSTTTKILPARKLLSA
jgi:hypothetical protein